MNFLQSFPLSLLFSIIFYIALFLLLPYGIYLLWKKRKKTGILVIGIFVISIIVIFIYVDDYYGYDDAIYVGLRLIEILSRSNESISGLLSVVPKYYSTPEIRLNCSNIFLTLQSFSFIV